MNPVSCAPKPSVLSLSYVPSWGSKLVFKNYSISLEARVGTACFLTLRVAHLVTWFFGPATVPLLLGSRQKRGPHCIGLRLVVHGGCAEAEPEQEGRKRSYGERERQACPRGETSREMYAVAQSHHHRWPSQLHWCKTLPVGYLHRVAISALRGLWTFGKTKAEVHSVLSLKIKLD